MITLTKVFGSHAQAGHGCSHARMRGGRPDGSARCRRIATGNRHYEGAVRQTISHVAHCCVVILLLTYVIQELIDEDAFSLRLYGMLNSCGLESVPHDRRRLASPPSTACCFVLLCTAATVARASALTGVCTLLPRHRQTRLLTSDINGRVDMAPRPRVDPFWM